MPSIFTGIAQIMVDLASDNSALLCPMSVHAREVVNAMLEWIGGHTRWNQRQLVDAIVSKWDPIIFEDAAHEYDSFVHKLTKTPLAKKATFDEAVDAFFLSRMTSEWRARHSVTKHNKVGIASSPAVRPVYEYLTRHFLLIDFNDFDLNKIIEMSQWGLELIKTEAQQITDDTKKTIPYLYAVVRGSALREEAIGRRNAVLDAKNTQKLDAILATEKSARQNKVPFRPDPTRHERWAREVAFREAYESLKDKEER